ncbi:MAG: hypothetical protein ACOYMI_07850 [Phycisphaerales bacterium]|jgi:hypothetical protein
MIHRQLGAWMVWLLAAHAGARVIEPAMTQPAVAAGGVLAIPMQCAEGDRWPERMRVERVDGGSPIEGTLAWIAASSPMLERGWTRADERLEIRPIVRAPADTAVPGVVLLLAELPPDLRGGSLRVAGTQVDPVWFPLAEPRPDARKPALAAGDTPTLDRPDLLAPAEWFRWWLLADEAGCSPPEPPGDRESVLYALHRAQLWQAGLDRVERVSPGVARELREHLTATCVDQRGDRAVRVAAWIARADELTALLSTLLDVTRTDEQVMEAALTRIRERPPVTCWVEADAGTSLRLACANPSPEAITLRVSWVESRFSRPLQIEVSAAGMARQNVDRPAELMPDPLTRNAAPGSGTLLIAGNGWEMRLPVPPARIVPRPPGYAFGVLRPPLSLADAQRQRIAPPPAEWLTTASLRKRFGRWEVFAECLRPQATDLDELELVVAGEGVGSARVRVHEVGDPIVDGAPGIDAPRVQRGSFLDRWRCTVELPPSWVPRQGALMLGVARSPGGAGTRQTGVIAVPDWMPIPLATLDASAWWSGSSPMSTTAVDSGEPLRSSAPAMPEPSVPEPAPVTEAPRQPPATPAPKRPNFGPPV